MKRVNKLLQVMAAAALIIGCSDTYNSSDLEAGDTDSNTSTSIGYVSFADLSLSVDYEQEDFSDITNSEYDSTKAATKATSEAADDHVITILSEATGEVAYKATYAEAKSSGPIELPAGSYTLKSLSCEEIAGAAWEEPEYASKDQTIVVGNQQVTTIESITCYLANIKTSVSLSADILSQFKTKDQLEDGDTPLTVTLELGENSLLFAEDETRAGYFAEQADDSSISITLNGMYNIAAVGEEDNYVAISWEEEITGVAAGQSRNISIKIDNYHDGKINLEITVQTWVYDSPLGVSLFSQNFLVASEDGIVDPDDQSTDANAPVLTLDGGLNIEDMYVISESIFDFDADSYSPTYKANLTPVSGSSVALVELRVSSSNSSFMSALDTAGYTDGVITAWSEGSANSALSDYITIRQSDGVLSLTMRYAGMNALYGFSGNHEVLVYAVDDAGRRSFTTLYVNVVTDGGVEIVWCSEDGTIYDFDTRYEISPTTTLPVVLDITTSTGITVMTVDITSDVLTAEELAGLNLAPSMDLINPESEAMATSLRSLGFPVGDEVEGLTELTLDITTFMPMLASLPASVSGAESDFKITVSDASSTETKTIKVVQE